ncbi:MAG: response regulator [Deltaproteobacteria bacterium]|nr:response regulator [Deltaproteobacteria bacterium]
MRLPAVGETAALDKAVSERFDLVITDMTMPRVTGEIMAKEIMELRSDIPIILCINLIF